MKTPMMEETIAHYADGLNYDSKTPEDFAEKKNHVKEVCERIGRDFDELKWSMYLSTSVIGRDIDDFEMKKQDLLNQPWLFEEITDELKPKVLEVMLREYVSGTIDDAVQKISQYKEEVDVMILGLPMMGNLLENGLDTIKILKDHIVSKL